MPDDSSDHDTTFAHALGLPEEERHAYREDAYGDDPERRDCMTKLLLDSH